MKKCEYVPLVFVLVTRDDQKQAGDEMEHILLYLHLSSASITRTLT